MEQINKGAQWIWVDPLREMRKLGFRINKNKLELKKEKEMESPVGTRSLVADPNKPGKKQGYDLRKMRLEYEIKLLQARLSNLGYSQEQDNEFVAKEGKQNNMAVPGFEAAQEYERKVYEVVADLHPEVQRFVIYNVSMYVRLKIQESISQEPDSSALNINAAFDGNESHGS